MEVMDLTQSPGKSPTSTLRRGTTERWRHPMVAALSTAAKVLGGEVSYDTLMGESGAAYLLQFPKNPWTLDSFDVTRGINTFEWAKDALGFRERESSDPNEPLPRRLHPVLERITELPGKANAHLTHFEDFGTVVIYRDRVLEEMTRHFSQGTTEEDEERSWIVMILGDEVEGKGDEDGRNAFPRMQAIERAVSVAYHPAEDGLWCGMAAYAQWASSLREDNIPGSAKCRDIARSANGWIYASLLDSRMSAAACLRSMAHSPLEEPRRSCVMEAASLYEDLVVILMQGMQYVPHWHPDSSIDWTWEMRRAQTEVIQEVRTLEARAVNQLELALLLSALPW